MVRKITKWNILIPFLGDYQRHVILADIEREIGVPHQTIRKHAETLVKSGILREEEKPRNVMYSLDRENPMVLNYLSSAEKILLEEILERSTALKRLYEMLSPHMKSSHILIFGSSARGTIGKDIDILVVGQGIGNTGKLFQKTYGKRVHVITNRTIPGGALGKEILLNHLIFNGFDYFVKEFWESVWRN